MRPNYDNVIPPTNLSISTNQRTYAMGENVTFSFNSQNSSEQYIPIDVNGVRKHFIDVTGKTQYTTKFTEPGIYSYTLYVRNSVGEANVDYKTFFVGDVGEMITPTITTDKKTYCPNENVHISWQKTGATTDFANYWLIITEIASNKEVYGGNAGSTWNVDKNYFDIKLSNSGMYYIAVYSVPWNNKETRQRVATTKISVGAVGNMTTPIITTDKKTYFQNENVHISWDKTSVDTDFAEYWLIIKELTNNKEIYGGNVGSSWNVNKNYYDIKLSSIGEYSISVYAVPWNNKESRQKVSTTSISVKCNHKTTATAAKAATCTADGNTAYWYCSNCKKYFSDSACTKEITLASTVINATGHKWGTAAYTWSADNKTCTATRVCANDSSHKETETVNTTSSETKKPTCINTGIDTYTATFKNTAFAKQTKNVEKPTTDHHRTTTTVAPTETTAGYDKHTCDFCGDFYIDNIVPPIPVTDIPTVSYVPGDSAVKLTWTTVSNAEKYAVCGYISGKWQKLAEGNGTSYTLKDLKAGKEYTVAIIAKTNGNWSQDFSNAIVVTPKAEEISKYPKVTDIEYSEQYHQFRLTWNAVDGATEYGIAVKLGGKWKIQAYTNKTNFTSPKLREGSTVEMVVCAKVNGEWDISNINNRAFKVTVK